MQFHALQQLVYVQAGVLVIQSGDQTGLAAAAGAGQHDRIEAAAERLGLDQELPSAGRVPERAGGVGAAEGDDIRPPARRS